jgi:hypothetical protein
MNFDSLPPNFYAMILCALVSSSSISLYFLLMATPNLTNMMRIKLIPFSH